jgi:uncharacterized membrane protein YgdD (TMEM256/DUF423 family)
MISKIINVGSSPTTLDINNYSGSLMVKQLAHNVLIAGSSPVRGMFFILLYYVVEWYTR